MARDDEVVHNRSTEALARGARRRDPGGEPRFVLDLPVRAAPGRDASANFPVDGGAVTRVLYVLDPADARGADPRARPRPSACRSRARSRRDKPLHPASTTRSSTR